MAFGLAGSMLRADGRSGLLTDGITAAGVPCDQCWLIVTAGCSCRGFRRLTPEPWDKAPANCAKQKRETCHSEFTFHSTSHFRNVCNGTTTPKGVRLPGSTGGVVAQVIVFLLSGSPTRHSVTTCEQELMPYTPIRNQWEGTNGTIASRLVLAAGILNEHPNKRFARTPNQSQLWAFPNRCREQGWSQGVDATLACSLSAGVSNPNVFRDR